MKDWNEFEAELTAIRRQDTGPIDFNSFRAFAPSAVEAIAFAIRREGGPANGVDWGIICGSFAFSVMEDDKTPLEEKYRERKQRALANVLTGLSLEIIRHPHPNQLFVLHGHGYNDGIHISDEPVQAANQPDVLVLYVDMYVQLIRCEPLFPSCRAHQPFPKKPFISIYQEDEPGLSDIPPQKEPSA